MKNDKEILNKLKNCITERNEDKDIISSRLIESVFCKYLEEKDFEKYIYLKKCALNNIDKEKQLLKSFLPKEEKENISIDDLPY